MSERPSSSKENAGARKLAVATKKKSKKADKKADEKEIETELCKKLTGLLNRDVEKKEDLPKNDFCCDFSFENLPRIQVDGWELKYPCDADVCAKLFTFATQAPIGKGTETVMDKEIRDGWHIDASKVKFISQDWVKMFSDSEQSEFLDSIRQVLAPDCQKISAKFYKMLVYENGSFFRSHRDTQRKDNHFGTIVVFLPSCYSGGELVVAHAGVARSFQFGLSPDSGALKVNMVSFFTDCLHEVKPITDGHRVNLTYELFFEGPTAPELPKPMTGVQQEICDSLTKFFELSKLKDRKAGVLLQHRYALASLNPIMLKGVDRITYSSMVASGKFDVELTGVTVKASTLDYDCGCGDDNAFHKAEHYYKESLEQKYDVEFEISRYNPKTVYPRNRVRSPVRYERDYEAEWEDKRRYFARLDREQAGDIGSEEEEEEEFGGNWSPSSSSDSEDVNVEKVHGENLSSFTIGDLFDVPKEEKDEIEGPVVFLNSWKDYVIGDVITRSTEPTGNTGTKFELQYTAAALLIEPKKPQAIQ